MAITAESVTLQRLDELLDDESIPVVHRALWLLLWESDVRVMALVAMDVKDATGFGERATELLGRVVDGRSAGPLFAVEGRALSWEQAVRTAAGYGIAIHAFRTGGKNHRRAAQQGHRQTPAGQAPAPAATSGKNHRATAQ